MKKFEKKKVLATEEFAKTSKASFFQKLGFEVVTTYDPSDLKSFSFVLDNAFPEAKLPRLKSEYGHGFSKADRAYIEIEKLNSTASDLMNNYFSDQEELDLIDRYSKNHKDILTLKIQDYLSLGYYTDLVIQQAYKESFNIEQIRESLNNSLKFVFKLAEEKGSTLPIEISFSNDGNVFAVQLMITIKNFDFGIDLFKVDNFQEQFIKQANFVDFTYLESREKLFVSTLWFKEDSGFKGLFFNQVVKRSKENLPENEVGEASSDPDIKYHPMTSELRNEASVLSLARKFAVHVKNLHRDEEDYLNSISMKQLRSDLVTYLDQGEVSTAPEDAFKKAILILKEQGNEFTLHSSSSVEDGNDTIIVKSQKETDDLNEKNIISGNGNEEKNNSLQVKGNQEQSEDSNLSVKNLNTSQSNPEIEKELKELRYKLEKSLEQNIKAKKMLELLKNEMVKAKTSFNGQGANNLDSNEVQNQISLAKSADETKILALTKEVHDLKNKESNLNKEVTDLSNLNLKLEIKVSTLENKITELNKTISTSDGTLAVEKAQQLENDNKLLQAKLDIANKNLANVASNINNKENELLARKEKEVETLKSQIQMAHSLINKFKSEKLDAEDKFKIEIDTLRKKLIQKEQEMQTSHSPQNAKDEKAIEDKISILQVEKKQAEDKFKEQSLELKKVEHKVKILSSQLEQATKKAKSNSGGSQASNEAYIKQVENANKKVGELAQDLAEKKKEILKQKQDNNQLSLKVQELEKKLAQYEKKAA